MSFILVRAEGLWIPGSVVDPEEFGMLDAGRVDALDGKGGGSYSLDSALVLGGAGLTLSGNNHHVAGKLTVDALAEITIADAGIVRANGTGNADIKLYVVSNVALLDVESGAAIHVKAGGALDVFGALTLKNTNGPGSITAEANTSITMALGSTLTAADGSTVELAGETNVRGDFTIRQTGAGALKIEAGTTNINAGTINHLGTAIETYASGSEVTFSGDVTLNGATNWPKLSSNHEWSRAAKALIPLTFNGGSPFGPTAPDAWQEKSDASSAPCFRTVNSDSSGALSVLEFTDLPIGAKIAQVTVTTKGTLPGSIASNLPQYQIVSWSDSAAAGFTVHSSLVTDDANVATFGSTETQTTIAVSATTTVAPGRRYGLKVTHTYEPTNNQGCRIYECTATGPVEELRA